MVKLFCGQSGYKEWPGQKQLRIVFLIFSLIIKYLRIPSICCSEIVNIAKYYDIERTKRLEYEKFSKMFTHFIDACPATECAPNINFTLKNKL